MLLLIDNYDSFTYNVARYLVELDAEVKVVRNNDLSVDEISAMSLAGIVISPGPCTPDEAGISVPVIKSLHHQVPILGICLGHQSIAQAFGGKVVRASKVMHGKLSDIYHNGKGIFKGLPIPFCATRYHSLVVDAEHLPEELEVTAWTQNAQGEREDIMGLKHKYQPVEGVQFHPESVLSEHGHRLLQNFLDQSERR